jgi:hypothetical protein
MGVTTLGTKAYFAGGGTGSGVLTLVESYDVETGTWADVGYLSIARQVIAATSCGTKLFFGGGVNGSMSTVYQTIDVYDTNTGLWTIEYLSVGRFDISALSHGDTVMFAGGCNNSITCTNAVDVYDYSTDEWSVLNLSTPRAGMASAVVGDLAIFAGGFNTGGSVSDLVDIYHFTTKTWTTTTLSEARVWASAVTVGTKVIIAGGMKYWPDVPTSVVDIYNSTTGEWSTATLFESRTWLSAGAVNGKAYFAGGSNNGLGGTYDYSNIIERYDDASGIWEVVDALLLPRCSQGIAVSNYFLVAGGMSDEGIQSLVEVFYDPQTSISNQSEKNENFNIYPNPSKDKITISSTSMTENTELSIFNVSGEKVLERKLTETEIQLDISALPRGVYIVRLQNERMVEVGKMVKE